MKMGRGAPAGVPRPGMPARSNAGGAMRGQERAAAVKAMNDARPSGGMGMGMGKPAHAGGMGKPAHAGMGKPAFAGKPAGAGKPIGMAKGGAVPMKKMAGKAMAKGKKMMPAFLKKGMRGK